MATDTAVVIHITGQAWVREADGSLTPIYQGMQIPANVNIITAEGATVQLQVDGLPPITIGEERDTQLGGDVIQADLDPAINAITPSDADAARILTVLEAGNDPFNVLDPTAAVLQAGTDGAGGSSFTRLLGMVEATTPLGLEYPRLDSPQTPQIQPVGSGAGATAGAVADEPDLPATEDKDGTPELGGDQGDTPGVGGDDGEDVLDIRALLTNAGEGSLDGYLDVINEDGKTVIAISTQGNIGESGQNADQKIVLENVEFDAEQAIKIAQSLKLDGSLKSGDF